MHPRSIMTMGIGLQAGNGHAEGAGDTDSRSTANGETLDRIDHGVYRVDAAKEEFAGQQRLVDDHGMIASPVNGPREGCVHGDHCGVAFALGVRRSLGHPRLNVTRLAMPFETLLYDVDASTHVATITLNRPAQFNALNLDMARELMLATIAADEDPGVRCIVLTGAGKAFFAGGDLSTFGAAGDQRGALIKEMTTYFHAAISRLSRMDAPVIAAVNGVAAGAGFSTMLACDLVIAATSAKFTMAYTKSGLSPDGSSTWFLPRIVGLRRAQELTLTNRVLTAPEALEWGLLTRVVDDSSLMDEVSVLSVELASGPTRTLGAAKRLLRDSTDQGLESQMELEARAIAAASLTIDGREGVAAFLEKRAPKYQGR